MTAIRRASVALGSTALMGVVLLAMTMGVLLTMTAPIGAADKAKLSGCLVKGEDDGYLLINTPAEPGTTTAGDRAVTPGVLGTTPVFANIFYWLDKDDDLREHVGHRVEVEGDLKGDLKPGEIEIDRKDQWTEIEVKSNGRDMKARVPNASVVAGTNPDRKINVLVRRLDVDKVRMLDAVCR